MIKIQVEELKNQLKTLQTAIGDFEPYSKEFTKNTIDKVEKFNSDFIEEMKETLGNMADTKAPKLLKKVQEFHDEALKVVEEFEKRDKSISDQTNLNK